MKASSQAYYDYDDDSTIPVKETVFSRFPRFKCINKNSYSSIQFTFIYLFFSIIYRIPKRVADISDKTSKLEMDTVAGIPHGVNEAYHMDSNWSKDNHPN